MCKYKYMLCIYKFFSAYEIPIILCLKTRETNADIYFWTSEELQVEMLNSVVRNLGQQNRGPKIMPISFAGVNEVTQGQV